MRGRAGLFVVGGAAVAAGVLVASPNTYTWLRRKTGLEADEQFELDRPGDEVDPAEFPIDLREARLSLRARLAENQELTDEHERPGATSGRPRCRRHAALRGRERPRAPARVGHERIGAVRGLAPPTSSGTTPSNEVHSRPCGTCQEGSIT